jgi:hypothetical protein
VLNAFSYLADLGPRHAVLPVPATRPASPLLLMRVARTGSLREASSARVRRRHAGWGGRKRKWKVTRVGYLQRCLPAGGRQRLPTEKKRVGSGVEPDAIRSNISAVLLGSRTERNTNYVTLGLAE